MLHSAEERAREREIRATAVPALRPPRQETVYISLTRRQKEKKKKKKVFFFLPYRLGSRRRQGRPSCFPQQQPGLTHILGAGKEMHLT
jgi:hypothetical protein